MSNNQLDACCSSEYLCLKLQETFVDFVVLIVDDVVPVDDGVMDDRLEVGCWCAMDPSIVLPSSCVVGGENKEEQES